MAENSIKTTLYTRNIFSPEDADLYELTQLAGVTLDPNVFKIVTDLLKLNVQPASIVKVSRSRISFLSALRTSFEHDHDSDFSCLAPAPTSAPSHTSSLHPPHPLTVFPHPLTPNTPA